MYNEHMTAIYVSLAVSTVGFLALFACLFAIYKRYGWKPAKFSATALFAIPMLMLLSNMPDYESDFGCGFFIGYGLLISVAFFAYSAYIRYRQRNLEVYTQYIEDKVKEAGEPSEEELLRIRRMKTSYGDFDIDPEHPKIKSDLERAFLVDLWGQAIRKKIVRDDPFKWMESVPKKEGEEEEEEEA